MPVAWSTIQIFQAQRVETVRLVELWLIRTGTTCLLDLSFSQAHHALQRDLQPAVDIINLFISHSDRWRTISIFLDARFPRAPFLRLRNPENLVSVSALNLQGWDEYSLQLIWDEINQSKELRRVTWWYFIPQLTPWSQIEEIRLSYNALGPLVLILNRLTRLRSLFVTIRSTKNEIGLPVGGAAIRLSSLCTLHFSGQGIITLLERIVAPLLQHLHVEHQFSPHLGSYRDPLPYISQFLLRSKCSLTTLSITDYSPTQNSNNLLEFLRRSGEHLHSVHTLVLQYPEIPEEFLALLTIPTPTDAENSGNSSTTQTVYIPNLQLLDMKISNSNGLGAMIQSRFRYGSLQTANLVIALQDAFDDVLILKSLKEEGRDVKWLAS
ncbi:hypothetical protein AX16_001501 [Volvariella volvacea WC 439]|nr:hypothetical protein AX16_001501 [Volvariella volvacea WC 439]